MNIHNVYMTPFQSCPRRGNVEFPFTEYHTIQLIAIIIYCYTSCLPSPNPETLMVFRIGAGECRDEER